MPDLRLALVGTGRWGMRILATLNDLPGAHVAYVCVRSRGGLAGAPDRCEKVSSVRDLEKHDDIDGVIVATPASTHARIALPFLRKGIPVFIEKPMTTNERDAEALLRAARAGKTWIFPGHLHLFNSAYLSAKKAAASCGRIRFVFCEGISNGPRRRDVSVLWDWGSHGAYMIMDLLGMPHSVQAWGRDDWSMMRLRFPQADAWCVNSWLSPVKQNRVTIIGDRGTVIFDDAVKKKTPPLKAELHAFIRSLKKRSKPAVTGEDGARVVKILALAERSQKRDGDLVQLARPTRVQ